MAEALEEMRDKGVRAIARSHRTLLQGEMYEILNTGFYYITGLISQLKKKNIGTRKLKIKLPASV